MLRRSAPFLLALVFSTLLALACAPSERYSISLGTGENRLADARVGWALDRPDRMWLVSLEPHAKSPRPEGMKEWQAQFGGLRRFMGFPEHGRVEVGRTRARRLISELVSVAERWDPKSARPRCFKPRHGFRVERDGVSVELAVCFECAEVIAAVGKGAAGKFFIFNDPDVKAGWDKLLREAGVELTKN